jgi:hypothetical protein
MITRRTGFATVLSVLAAFLASRFANFKAIFASLRARRAAFFANLKALRACLCSAFSISRWFRAALAAFFAAAAFASSAWADVLPFWPLCDFFIFMHHLSHIRAFA